MRSWLPLYIVTVITVFLLGSCKKHSLPESKSSTLAPPPLKENVVSTGMTQEEVIAKLGNPIQKFIDTDKIETWTYLEHQENLKEGFQLGGLQVAFKDGKVFKVLPVMVRTQTYPKPKEQK